MTLLQAFLAVAGFVVFMAVFGLTLRCAEFSMMEVYERMPAEWRAKIYLSRLYLFVLAVVAVYYAGNFNESAAALIK